MQVSTNIEDHTRITAADVVAYVAERAPVTGAELVAPAPRASYPLRMDAPLTRRAIFAQAWPIMLGQATIPLVGLVDTAVIGRTGDTVALAGVARPMATGTPISVKKLSVTRITCSR